MRDGVGSLSGGCRSSRTSIGTESAVWLFLGALNGLLAVTAGAYGRHWLAGGDVAREMFQIASQYQMVHALALLAVAGLASMPSQGRLSSATVAGVAFAVGVLLFSGSLYAFGLTGGLLLPGAAPAGGFALMAGWLALMWTALRSRFRA